MTTKPFKPNKSKKTAAMKKAEKKVLEAITALQTAKENADHWADFASIAYFENQLNEFLSSDNGECGLSSFII